jgi:hypothetical protein
LEEGLTASLINVGEENGVYKIHLKIGERKYDSYVTKNGKLLFIEGIDLESTPIAREKEKAPQEVPKRDVPDLKVFVFSYCPYSLQYEKGLFPVVDLLSNKADIELVAIGAMHGEHEEIESKRQNCIREEQPDKYWAYLKCFAYSEGIKECSSKFYREFNRNETRMAECLEPYLNECFDKTNINKSKIVDCMKSRADGYYKSDVDLAKKYGIGSSPTPMLNEMILKGDLAARSPQGIKKALCEGFKSKPSECSQTLSNEIPSPGFGEGTSSSEGGGC